MSTTDRPKHIIHCIYPETTRNSTSISITTPLEQKNSFKVSTITSTNEDTIHVRSKSLLHTMQITAKDMCSYKQAILIEIEHDMYNELSLNMAQTFGPLFNATSVNHVSEKVQSKHHHQAQILTNEYMVLNRSYAEQVMQHYQKDDLVWIHDYQLLMVPYFLRKIAPNIKIGLSINSTFPYWDRLSLIQGHKDLLHSMLQADQIGFETTLDARRFATACTRLLQLVKPPSSKQIGVFPINNLNIGTSVLEKAESIRDMFPGKKIIFCRDTHAASVIRTLAALTELFNKDNKLIDKLVLIHLCATSVPVDDVAAIPDIVRQINQLYGTAHCVPVHFYHQDIDKEEQLALMAAADLGLFMGNHPSTSHIAEEFVMCQKQRHSPLIMSNNHLFPEGTINITADDPSNIFDLLSALLKSLNLSPSKAREQHEILYQHISKKDKVGSVIKFVERLHSYYALSSHATPSTEAQQHIYHDNLQFKVHNAKEKERNYSKLNQKNSLYWKYTPISSSTYPCFIIRPQTPEPALQNVIKIEVL